VERTTHSIDSYSTILPSSFSGCRWLYLFLCTRIHFFPLQSILPFRPVKFNEVSLTNRHRQEHISSCFTHRFVLSWSYESRDTVPSPAPPFPLRRQESLRVEAVVTLRWIRKQIHPYSVTRLAPPGHLYSPAPLVAAGCC
jgi:hypothetical protein